MQVTDIMSTPPVTVEAEATLYETIAVMLEHSVGSAVVVDEWMVGVITRSDILRAAYAAGDELDSIPVTRGMSDDVVTTKPETSIRHALELMRAHDIKKLPVVDDLDLVGVVTATDIARHQPERVRELQSAIERRDDWTD
ncbi:CBS domain-containing protein [Halovenus aranensis]|jgi:CBS domain-containing protein|uniref:CBS domain-containing protein n=1 Tax=Halovenus aranensis TaxID=890420 RepID=A0A1G8T0V7_9EURY|nr:CBS domain-containing protein [Halovenus aranensis]SDJ35202.1 CBS domain-containing protein [Halovenus aranensis]